MKKDMNGFIHSNLINISLYQVEPNPAGAAKIDKNLAQHQAGFLFIKPPSS